MAVAAAKSEAEPPSADPTAGGDDVVYDNVASALYLASIAGQLDLVLTLLEKGARPNGGAWVNLTAVEVEGISGDWHYWRDRVCSSDPTPLHEAARCGHVAIVKALLAAGARRNPRASMANCHSPLASLPESLTHEPGGYAPLHFAALSGHAAVVTVLAEAGANVDILGGKMAETPLHLATRRGHTATMLALLHKWANVDAVNSRNQTALYEATSVATMELLLKAGADNNGRATRLTETPLGLLVSSTKVARLTSYSSEVDEATAMVKILLRHGANAGIPVGQQCWNPQDTLYCCTRTAADNRSSSRSTTPDSSPGHTPSSPIFSPAGGLKGGSLSRRRRRRRRRPAQGHVSPSSDSTQDCWSPKSNWWLGQPSSSPAAVSLLPYAAKNGVPSIVEALLGTGYLDPTEQDEHGKTPLHYAAQEGHWEALRLLLQAGAEVDFVANPTERITPLHLACRWARLDCVLELLRWGANLDARCVLPEDGSGVDCYAGDRRHRTPLQMVDVADGCANNSIECEEGEIIRKRCCGCAGEKEAGLVATRNEIRRAIGRETQWRRRGGVVVLLALLSKAKTKDAVATTQQGANITTTTATTATAPASSRRTYVPSNGGIRANLGDIFEKERDSYAVAACGHDTKRGRPVVVLPHRSNNSGDTIIGGEEAGSRSFCAPICSDMLEEEKEGEEQEKKGRSEGGGTDDEFASALAGLIDLGRANGDRFCLFRKIVRYL